LIEKPIAHPIVVRDRVAVLEQPRRRFRQAFSQAMWSLSRSRSLLWFSAAQ
jgi:hypothetical protein